MNGPRPLLLALTLLAAATASRAARAGETLRLATVAPEASTWGKVLRVWEKVVAKKTHGDLDLRIYYNGIQGDEQAVVAKMRTGQLDGAALSSVGLSQIHRDVAVMQLPGVTNSWPLLDMVRALIGDEIEGLLRKKGFELLSWGDIGAVYQMSDGAAIRNPKDLRRHRPVVWRNEPVGPLIYSIIGQVVPVPLSPSEVLPALRAGTVEVIAAPVLAAEQMQWTPFVDHITDQIVVCATGGTVIRRDRLAAVPADTRQMLRQLQQKTAEIHNARIRKFDREALDRVEKRMTVVQQSDADRVDWYRVFLKAVKRMRHGLFSRDLIDRVLAMTGKG